jgi:molecular chaperone DnaK
MSKEDIEKAVKDAEKFAEEDKKQKEAVDTKNQAESLIFQCEKTLGELGDKVTEEEKAPINAAKDNLKAKVEGGNTEEIKAAIEELNKAFYAISEKLYAQAQAQQNAENAQSGAQNDDGTINADFEDKN